MVRAGKGRRCSERTRVLKAEGTRVSSPSARSDPASPQQIRAGQGVRGWSRTGLRDKRAFRCPACATSPR